MGFMGCDDQGKLAIAAGPSPCGTRRSSARSSLLLCFSARALARGTHAQRASERELAQRSREAERGLGGVPGLVVRLDGIHGL
jgi:hypothetical protein